MYSIIQYCTGAGTKKPHLSPTPLDRVFYFCLKRKEGVALTQTKESGDAWNLLIDAALNRGAPNLPAHFCLHLVVGIFLGSLR